MTDETDQQPGAQQATQDNAGRRFQIHKVYLKDVSFESPAAPGIFSADADVQPEISLQLNTETQRVGESFYEVVLGITVTGVQQERTIFLVEIKQAGLFEIAGFDDEQRNELMGAHCPSALFPFAREVVADLVQKGGLPQLVLQPINFEGVYAQRRREQQASAAGAESGQ